MLSTYSTVECAKVTRPPDPTTVASVTGSYIYTKVRVGFF